jgi:hypothetical protein
MAYAGVPGAKVATVSRIHVKKKSFRASGFFLSNGGKRDKSQRGFLNKGQRRAPPPTAMEAAGGGAEDEQVMSEVHLGCPPHFSGLLVSRFSFSSRPLGTCSSLL